MNPSCHNLMLEQVDAITYLSELEVEDESLRELIEGHLTIVRAAIQEDLID